MTEYLVLMLFGVTLDEYLNWNSHINVISMKIGSPVMAAGDHGDFLRG